MDKSYKKTIIGMAVSLMTGMLITTIMTVFQKSILRASIRIVSHNRMWRDMLKASVDFRRMGNGTVIPYYMFFCMLTALVCFILTLIVVSNKSNKGKPGLGIMLFVVYGATIPIGVIYTFAGGDKLLNSPKLAGNASLLSLAMSVVISPVMMVFTAFFAVTVIMFIVKAVKYNRAKG